MIPCPSCGRHHRVDDASCPFCGSSEAPPRARSRSTLGRRTLHLVGGAVTTLVLAACYGAGPVGEDIDGDGWDEYDDCDETNADINPGATEDCTDGVDNDCNGLVDDEDGACSDGTDGTDATDDTDG